MFWLALVCSLLVGYGVAGSKDRHWLHLIAFAIIAVISDFVILEIKYPRTGFIRLDAYDQVLIDARQSMQ